MPNYCFNDLTVKGKAKDIKRFDDQFKKKHWEFEGGSTSCMNTCDLEAEYGKYVAYRTTPYSNMFATEEDKITRLDVHYIESKTEVESYSFSNFVEMTEDAFLNGWYNWSNKHWGTKWDACDLNESIDELEEAIKLNDMESDIAVYYNFTTAWAPPMPVIIIMSSQYPELKFEFSAEESGCGYAGVYELENGLYTKHEEADDEGGLDYKHFMQKHFDTEYYTCTECGALLEEWEIEDNENKCPECDECNKFIAPDKSEVTFNAQ